MSLIGGYGTRAGAAKNPWISHVKAFAKAKGVKYFQALRHHTDELRAHYYNGLKRIKPPKSQKPKRIKPPKSQKPKQKVKYEPLSSAEMGEDAWMLGKPNVPRPKSEKKYKYKLPEPAWADYKAPEDLDVEMSSERLPLPPSAPLSLPMPIEWEEGEEASDLPVVVSDLKEAPDQLLLQAPSHVDAPSTIKLETTPRDYKPKPFKPKPNRAKAERQKYLQSKRAKLPRVKNEPLLLEAPLPYVKPEFADLPDLEPGLRFMRPNKRKAEQDIEPESKALVLSRDVVSAREPKSQRIDVLEPVTWVWIWDNLFNSPMRKIVNKAFGKHHFGPKSIKQASLLVTEAAREMGYTRASRTLTNDQFNQLMARAQEIMLERGIKLNGAGYRGGNLWDDIVGAANKVGDFVKDAYNGVKKGVESTRNTILPIAKHIPIVGDIAGEVEKGLDMVGLGYRKKSRKMKKLKRMY